MALTIRSSSTPSTTRSWLILRFEDPHMRVGHDIMFLNDPTESLQTTASLLEETLYERFDRLGNAHRSPLYTWARLPPHSDHDAAARHLSSRSSPFAGPDETQFVGAGRECDKY